MPIPGDSGGGGGAKGAELSFEGGGDCWDGTSGCCIVACGEYGIVCGFVTAGGSIRLAIEGDADARFTCGACLSVPGTAGRDSIVEPLIGS